VTLWIKVCGLTTADGVAAALDAGVDALGFVFSPSVRRLTFEQAVALARPARGRVQCVAVMRDLSQTLLDEVLREFGPDAVQADAPQLDRLRVPREVALLPVLRAGQEWPMPLPLRVLFEGAVSGMGMTADWSQAATLARRTELVLAGGLTPDNVAAAIARVRPCGVDVSSGVEASAGVKSGAQIARFVAAARAASAALPRIDSTGT
jgi:phosphoribosylanthranilate isomerase